MATASAYSHSANPYINSFGLWHAGSGNIVCADGSVKSDKAEGSIHQVGAAAQNAAACNGWEYWHYKDAKKGLVCIDELRQVIRA